MTIIDPVAIYAAFVSTVVAAWTIYSEIQARQPHLRVEGLFQLLLAEPGDIERIAALNRTGEHQPLQWICMVSVVNVGQRAVHVSEVQLRQNYAGTSGAAFLPVDWEPTKLEAGQKLDVKFIDDHSDVDLGYPIWADADLDTGDTFQSDLFGPATSTGTVVVMPGFVGEALAELAEADGKKFYWHVRHDPRDQSP